MVSSELLLCSLAVCRSSFTCGLAGAIASNPVDVVRTRMMNQRAIVGSTELYRGTLDGLVKVRVGTALEDEVGRALCSRVARLQHHTLLE